MFYNFYRLLKKLKKINDKYDIRAKKRSKIKQSYKLS